MAPEPHLGESDAHCPTQEGAEARHLQGGRRHSDHLLHRSGARPAGGVYERRSVDARPEAEAVTAPCGFWSATWSVALDMFFAGGGGSGRKSAKSQAAVLPTEGAPVRGRPYLREYHRRLRFSAFPSHSRRAHPERNPKRRFTSHSRTSPRQFSAVVVEEPAAVFILDAFQHLDHATHAHRDLQVGVGPAHVGLHPARM